MKCRARSAVTSQRKETKLLSKTSLNHAVDGGECPLSELLIELNEGLIVPQGVKGIFEGNLIHMRAANTTDPDDLFLGILGDNIIAHAAFGKY